MVHALPKELRVFIALAAVALLGGLMIGFTSQHAAAKPVGPEGPFVNPCVNWYTGHISHADGECPSGTYALDLSSGYHTLCVSMYTKKFRYQFSNECGWAEFGIYVDGKTEVWGCVNNWTGDVTWIPSPLSSCGGRAMPFDTGFGGCRYVFGPAANDTLVAESQC